MRAVTRNLSCLGGTPNQIWGSTPILSGGTPYPVRDILDRVTGYPSPRHDRDIPSPREPGRYWLASLRRLNLLTIFWCPPPPTKSASAFPGTGLGTGPWTSSGYPPPPRNWIRNLTRDLTMDFARGDTPVKTLHCRILLNAGGHKISL